MMATSNVQDDMLSEEEIKQLYRRSLLSLSVDVWGLLPLQPIPSAFGACMRENVGNRSDGSQQACEHVHALRVNDEHTMTAENQVSCNMEYHPEHTTQKLRMSSSVSLNDIPEKVEDHMNDNGKVSKMVDDNYLQTEAEMVTVDMTNDEKMINDIERRVQNETSGEMNLGSTSLATSDGEKFEGENVQDTDSDMKMMKRLLRCMTKTFCLTRAGDVEMYPSPSAFVDVFLEFVGTLRADVRRAVDRLVKSKGIATITGMGSRELTNVRGEIAYNIVRGFWSGLGLPYPCGSSVDHLKMKRDEMRKKMMEDSSWRVRGSEPWGAEKFKNVIDEVLYRDYKELKRRGYTLQQLAFAHMVLDCDMNNKSRPARTAQATQEMRRIEEVIITTHKTRVGKLFVNVIPLDREKQVVEIARRISERQDVLGRKGKNEVLRMKDDHKFLSIVDTNDVLNVDVDDMHNKSGGDDAQAGQNTIHLQDHDTRDDDISLAAQSPTSKTADKGRE
ncbi:hypothetical protein CBR_g36763 [Chara braunii]|uniref:Uncharacterized protein n=1 Tax=Chara braunii TaxID=69332 RepID=A0A388LLH6_CHABU|nr:hypothetical protein CBR_g36763 [Chara braunii]|eukprot:GBG83147.1 hypothetical protein CBR_g36763 [Chara braunii]